MECTYRTYFKLTECVNDFDEARDYLTEDDMTKYLIGDDRSASCRDKIKNIVWVLTDESSGHIDLTTTAELTTTELESISNWVVGQNADGLGEGFEQQKFACYVDRGLTGYDGEDWDDTEVITSFDWQTNPYTFELVHKE